MSTVKDLQARLEAAQSRARGLARSWEQSSRNALSAAETVVAAGVIGYAEEAGYDTVAGVHTDVASGVVFMGASVLTDDDDLAGHFRALGTAGLALAARRKGAEIRQAMNDD